MWLLLLMIGCADKDTDTFSLQQSPHVADTAEVPDMCPEGMIQVAGRHIVSGEWDADVIATYAPNIIPESTWELETFCMDAYPWPGVEGEGWMPDGLHWDQVVELEALLAQIDLRLCTLGELLYAAGGADAWRYPYAPENFAEDICDPEDHTPLNMGTYTECVSTMGFSDFGIRSAWARLDDQALLLLANGDPSNLPEGDGSYGIFGGTSRQDTFHAPSNFGIHFYGPGGIAYVTDDVRVCADPWADPPNDATERKVSAMRDSFLSQGSYAAMLGE
jgi:hypothetical protein